MNVMAIIAVSRDGSDGRFAVFIERGWGSSAKLEFRAAKTGKFDVTWSWSSLSRR